MSAEEAIYDGRWDDLMRQSSACGVKRCLPPKASLWLIKSFNLRII
ncbi:hypothetical protein [Trichormus variabilis]|nr:hypothetical protein [Trichormus variabilis]